jgi:hypothetical protein
MMLLLLFACWPRTVIVLGAPALHDDTVATVPEQFWFHAADHLAELQILVDEWSGCRRLWCLDAFGASKRMAVCWIRRGLAAEPFDVKLSSGHDLVTSDGCKNFLQLGMRMHHGAMLVGGPPCSLFGGCCINLHKRHLDPTGDVSNEKVRLSNLITQNFVECLKLLKSKRFFYMLIEQPAQSWMFKTPWFLSLIAFCGLLRYTTHMLFFNHEMVKASHLLTDLPGGNKLSRKLTKAAKQRLLQKRDERHRKRGTICKEYVKYSSNAGGQRTFMGTRFLQDSAQYTAQFCTAVYNIWFETQKCSLYDLMSRVD